MEVLAFDGRFYISLVFSFVFKYYYREKVLSVAFLLGREQAVQGLIAVIALFTSVFISCMLFF